MEKYRLFFKKNNNMITVPTLVCVKQVKQESPEEWDESMPLPGDIIEGFAEDESDEFVSVQGKSDLSSQLGKISQQVEAIWVKIRRGDRALKLRARIVVEKSSMLQRKFSIKADTDDRHVAVLGDLTFEQCTELQEKSRKVVNVNWRGFNRRGVKYDWKKKMGTQLPDQRSNVVSSIVFTPLQGEYCIEVIEARCLAWFSAAVSSGVPLIFVSVQTEQMLTSERTPPAGREIIWGKQQNHSTAVHIVQAVRLWFLPGVAEVLLEITPEPGETRFGMDIKRTDEGFMCIYSVTKGSAADRAGLRKLQEEANASGYLPVISRLEGKSLMPSSVCSDGLIQCCDQNEIRDTLTSAIDQTDGIQLHIMVWPNQTCARTAQPIGAQTLKPPNDYHVAAPFYSS